MKIIDFLLELFYPSRCAFCGKCVKSGEGMCIQCEKLLPYTGENNRKQHFANVELCVSPLYYEGAVRKALLRYKFAGAASYSRIFAKISAKCIDETQISCDIITWVSLSRKRRRRRGYDQAQLLAESAAKELGLPCEGLLKKTRDNPAQSSLKDAAARKANVIGIYDAIHPEIIDGASILLVDDILTTGATLRECVRVLRDAGAARVLCATLAASDEK